MTIKAWEDDVLKGFKYIKGFNEFLEKERAQLYGTIIYLMISNNLDEIELPTIDTFIKYHEDYYIQYYADGEKFKAKLVLMDNKDGNQD